MTNEQIDQKLAQAVLHYDVKQEKKRYYNRHALTLYLNGVDNVMADIARGVDLESAIRARFNDRLLDFVLRHMGFEVAK